MTKTVAIIQARLGSSRLPAKVLLPLPTGRTVIEEVIHRAKQIKGVDEVVVAIPEKDVAILEPYISVRCVAGSETDVLSRYAKAAKIAAADVVMRITADCPMIDPGVCRLVLVQHRTAGGYVSNTIKRSWPQGYDCEVFNAALLYFADANATHTYDREHVTPYLVKLPICHGPQVVSGWDRSHERLTLDTLEDYRNIYQLMLDEAPADCRTA